MKIEMLKCGCSGMMAHNNPHDGLASGHPTCIVHECCEVVPAPDLTGRLARCAYYGKEVNRNECDRCYGVCSDERPSNVTHLAFFEYHPDQPYDEFYCGCHSWD